jgi:hypothetical protein
MRNPRTFFRALRNPRTFFRAMRNPKTWLRAKGQPTLCFIFGRVVQATVFIPCLFFFFFFFYFQTHPVIWNAAEAFSTLLERNADGTFVEATFNSNIEKRHSKNGQLNSRNDEMNRHIAPLTPQLTDAFTDVCNCTCC